MAMNLNATPMYRASASSILVPAMPVTATRNTVVKNDASGPKPDR